MPPLIHIGYHKTASDWLQRSVLTRPDLGLDWRRKSLSRPINDLISIHPLDFRPEPFAAAFRDILAAGEAAGKVPVVSYERLSGHPFAGGYDSKEIAQRLAQVFPDARILMVFREQRDIILSTYRQYVKAGGALTLATWLEPPTYRHPRIPHFQPDHFKYHRLLEAYQGLFGASRVLALPYEQLRERPTALVTSVLSFAGAAFEPDVIDRLPYGERPNQGASAATVVAGRLFNRLAFQSDINPAPLFPWSGADRPKRWIADQDRRLPQWLKRRAEKGFRRTVEAFAAGRYGESNAAMAAMTGLDLAAYGYDMPAPAQAP